MSHGGGGKERLVYKTDTDDTYPRATAPVTLNYSHFYGGLASTNI